MDLSLRGIPARDRRVMEKERPELRELVRENGSGCTCEICIVSCRKIFFLKMIKLF